MIEVKQLRKVTALSPLSEHQSWQPLHTDVQLSDGETVEVGSHVVAVRIMTAGTPSSGSSVPAHIQSKILDGFYEAQQQTYDLVAAAHNTLLGKEAKKPQVTVSGRRVTVKESFSAWGDFQGKTVDQAKEFLRELCNKAAGNKLL